MFQSVMLDIISMIYTEDHDGLKRECEIFFCELGTCPKIYQKFPEHQGETIEYEGM